ncbi:MAG: YebC/PmpR family DNA-binding transcriptional regulator [Cytophagales bacterium]|nr:YebC/PmpR family DNA-binding transcriptional regulator [Cytophagales bacterium]
MSGHSKWATTKHKKGLLDAKRGKIFTKVSRGIEAAVRRGGNDPANNPYLRLAIQNAKAVNMPKDNIDRILKKKDNTEYTPMTYEGNGPHGSAFIIECLTDNANRTVGELRALFSRGGGVLGKTGSVSYNFDRKSIFTVTKNEISNIDDLLLEGIEYGLEDISDYNDEEEVYVVGGYESFGTIQTFLEGKKISILEARIKYIPKSYISISGEDYEKMISFIDKLEDNDDVQNIYHNIEIK